jgi:hypothetical protein
VLDQGAILAQGRPDEIQGDALVRTAYLGDLARAPAEVPPAEVTPSEVPR